MKQDEREYIQPTDFWKSCCTDLFNCTVLDAGCGNGSSALPLAIMGARVTGVDIDAASVEYAKHRLQNGSTGVLCDFVIGNIESLPFANESFDIVFSRSTFQYLQHERAIHELLRVLKSEGDCILIQNLPSNPFVQLYRFLRKNGIVTIEQKEYINTIRDYINENDISGIVSHFQEYHEKRFYLFRPISLMMCKLYPYSRLTFIFDGLIDAVDRSVLSLFPFVDRWAWMSTIVCRKKKN